MTREEIIEELIELQNEVPEVAHERADELICEFLVQLGYEDVVDEYDAINKSYD